MNSVQKGIVGVTEFIESLLVPAFLMLFAIAVSGFHIFKFIQEPDGAVMGVVMGVGVSMMTIFFANRTLRPHGQERWVAMAFLVFFASLSTVWQFLYQRDHFDEPWIAATVAIAMPIAEIGLGIVAALQKNVTQNVQKPLQGALQHNLTKHTEQPPNVPQQSMQLPPQQHAPVEQPQESPVLEKGQQAPPPVQRRDERLEFASTDERRAFVEQWVQEHDGITPDTLADLNVAELTRELAQVVKASNRTLRRDVDAAIERFIVDASTVDGKLLTQEIHVSMNGKGH